MEMRCTRIAIALATLTGLANPAIAKSWPTRPVTVIVPFAAGGNVDAAARISPSACQRGSDSNS